MNVLPIIIRELRAEARHPVNYAMRMLGATILTIFLGVFLSNMQSTQSGDSAFLAMSYIVFCGIWIAVPILTADCLSREKREGTLGLLFLTPLKPFEIILGKGTIHAIRSLTLIIAVVPVVTIPFLLGGLTSANVFAGLILDLIALLLSLAAGLLASSLCRRWTRAVILAEIFAILFFFAFSKLALSLLGGAGPNGNTLGLIGSLLESAYYSTRYAGFGPAVGFPTINFYSVFSTILAAAIMTFVLVVFFASRRLKQTWQENPPSPRQIWIQKTLCTPRYWVGLLHRQNENRLSRNPIGWLQQYSWSARLSKWGWCFVVITIVSWCLTNEFRFLAGGLLVLKTAMLISVAFSAVGSFQREKQNGALELLLVTPLLERQIIFGRLGGIWGQFFPGFAILLITTTSVAVYFPNSGSLMDGLNFMAWICDFIVVPVVGLYFAMRVKNFMAAWLLACLLGIFVPQLLATICVKTFMGFYGSPEELRLGVRFVQMVVVTVTGLAMMSALHQETEKSLVRPGALLKFSSSQR